MTSSRAEPLPVARTDPFKPPPDLAKLREGLGGISPLAYPDGHSGWLVTGYEEARRLLADDRLSNRLELQRFPVPWPAREGFYGHPTPPGMFSHMDDPQHAYFRRKLAGHFNTHTLKPLEDKIQEIITERLDRMEDMTPPLDLVSHLAWPATTQVICELLGVPYEDREEFHRLNDVTASLETSAQQGDEAMAALRAYFLELVRSKRAHPTDDLLGVLAAGEDFPEDELVGIGFLLHKAGHETTANMFALGTLALITYRDQWERLCQEPSLIPQAVEELLRYLSILQFGVQRTAIEDIDIAGSVITEGQRVTISLPAANRDPSKFEDPDELDISRDARNHLAFGFGVHQCVGQHLARLELRIGFEGLTSRFPSLHSAVSVDELHFAADMHLYGVHHLPVMW